MSDETKASSPVAIMLAGKTCCYSRMHNWHRQYCGRPAKVERDGRIYCGVHDPQRADKVARQKESEATYEIQKEQRERDWKCKQVCDGVPTDQLEPGLLAKLLKDSEHFARLKESVEENRDALEAAFLEEGADGKTTAMIVAKTLLDMALRDENFFGEPLGVVASEEGLSKAGETSVQPGQESGNSTPKVTG